MSSVLTTALQFSFKSFSYMINQNKTYRAFSADSIVLRGTGVALDDQQHENNMGVNYLSYRVKRVILRGTQWVYPWGKLDKDNWLTVVLYKVPAKYETGVVQPAATTRDFLTPKEYVLYSNPRCVLSWNIFSYDDFSRPSYTEDSVAANVSLSCDKTFVLGPNDLLCCNLLTSTSKYQTYNGKWDITAKIYYDLN